MILVTGGTGLVGTHLLYDLTKLGKKVRVLKRSNSNVSNVKKVFSYYTSDVDSLLKNIEWVDADLLDVYSLMEAMEGVEEVYHCAAMVSFEKRHQEEMMKINIEGTANMVNAALEKGIKKFCHVSSIASIGRAERGGITSEETPWKSSPENSNYAISKYAAEREVWRAAEEGLNVVIVNPSLILGGGNWTQSSSNMFTKGYKGIKFYSEGTNGFVDVRDVVSIMIKLMNSTISNQRFLLNGENASFRNFFDLIHVAFGKPKASIKAGKFLTGFAWRAESVRALFTGAPALITRETSLSANRKSSFSSEKFLKAFTDYKFISLEQSVKDTCALYLKDLKK
ncbi:NAD-dependent epimerase/dehydratase family protein [soil metagenome]